MAGQERAWTDEFDCRAGVASPANYGILHLEPEQGPRVARPQCAEDELFGYVTTLHLHTPSDVARLQRIYVPIFICKVLIGRNSGGSIIVKQIGHATLTVDLGGGQKEEYIITLPRLRIDGLWYGSPYIELSENSYIQSSTGWLSSVSCLFLNLRLPESVRLILDLD